MIEINIPGSGRLHLEHLVLDYNGTLALDGALLPVVRDALIGLARLLQLHVLTADTFGGASKNFEGVPVSVTIIPPENQAEAKLLYVQKLGENSVAAIGNGRNDRLMLRAAALGIALIQKEGAASETIADADVICFSIIDALELFKNPKRLIATLRS